MQAARFDYSRAVAPDLNIRVSEIHEEAVKLNPVARAGRHKGLLKNEADRVELGDALQGVTQLLNFQLLHPALELFARIDAARRTRDELVAFGICERDARLLRRDGVNHLLRRHLAFRLHNNYLPCDEAASGEREHPVSLLIAPTNGASLSSARATFQILKNSGASMTFPVRDIISLAVKYVRGRRSNSALILFPFGAFPFNLAKNL